MVWWVEHVAIRSWIKTLHRLLPNRQKALFERLQKFQLDELHVADQQWLEGRLESMRLRFTRDKLEISPLQAERQFPIALLAGETVFTTGFNQFHALPLGLAELSGEITRHFRRIDFSPNQISFSGKLAQSGFHCAHQMCERLLALDERRLLRHWLQNGELAKRLLGLQYLSCFPVLTPDELALVRGNLEFGNYSVAHLAAKILANHEQPFLATLLKKVSPKEIRALGGFERWEQLCFSLKSDPWQESLIENLLAHDRLTRLGNFCLTLGKDIVTPKAHILLLPCLQQFKSLDTHDHLRRVLALNDEALALEAMELMIEQGDLNTVKTLQEFCKYSNKQVLISASERAIAAIEAYLKKVETQQGWLSMEEVSPVVGALSLKPGRVGSLGLSRRGQPPAAVDSKIE